MMALSVFGNVANGLMGPSIGCWERLGTSERRVVRLVPLFVRREKRGWLVWLDAFFVCLSERVGGGFW